MRYELWDLTVFSSFGYRWYEMRRAESWEVSFSDVLTSWELWELCRLPEPLSPGSWARDGMRDGAQGWKYSHRINHLVSCLMWTLPWLRRLWPEMTLWNLPQRQPRPQQSVCWCCCSLMLRAVSTHNSHNTSDQKLCEELQRLITHKVNFAALRYGGSKWVLQKSAASPNFKKNQSCITIVVFRECQKEI